MLKFDGYTATTTDVKPEQLVPLFDPINRGMTMREGRGFHQFGSRLSLLDQSGSEVGSVSWGGKHEGRSMIEVKGEHTPRVVEALRSLCTHRVTRMDSAADFDASGSWNRLLRAVLAIKRKHRLYGERRGDWDQPEKGRTMYLGAKTSTTTLRLYEKGKQPEYAHLARTDWVRAELQVRPAKEAKAAYAHLSPLDAWGASGWSRELAGKILAEHVDPHPAGTVWRKTDLDARVDWVCKQAGPTLVELLGELGSWECVGLTLGERIRELREKRH
jgi:DNA relaxase NicK